MIMDVILNRRLVQASADTEQGDGIIHDGSVYDPDAMRYAPAYCNNDLSQDSDFKYRTLIAFLAYMNQNGAPILMAQTQC